jgi:hypothetical protein
MAEPQLDWSSAEVHDSKLSVPLDGEPPRGWRDTFERTAALLGANDWDSVKLKGRQVEVTGLKQGGEEKLRHYLESIVQEANAAHAPEENEESDDDERSGDHDEDSVEERAASPDTEMTERFRSFAKTRRST